MNKHEQHLEKLTEIIENLNKDRKELKKYLSDNQFNELFELRPIYNETAIPVWEISNAITALEKGFKKAKKNIGKSDEYMKQKEKENTAYHEAGHGMAYYLLKIPFEDISIRPDESTASQGRVHSDFVTKFMNEYSNKSKYDSQTRQTIDKIFLIKISGHMSELLCEDEFNIMMNYSGRSEDYVSVVELIEFLWGRSVNVTWYYRRLLEIKTEEMLNKPSRLHAIDVLAKELLLREYIEGTEAGRIIESALKK